MNRPRWRWLAATGLSVLFALAFWWAQPGSAAHGDEPEPPRALPVEALTLEGAEGYTVADVHAGRIVPRRTSVLGFERGGLLATVAVDLGETVEADQLLAELDTRALRAERRELAARVEQTKTRLALARRTLERREGLRRSNHVSVEELDRVASEESAFEAELAAVRAALERVDVALELSQLIAPYAGRVAARRADEGTVLAPGQSVLEIVEDRALEAHVGLPPEVAARLAPGEVHTVRVDRAERRAVLVTVLPTLDTATRTVLAIFRVEDAPEAWRSGALARVELDHVIEGEGMWVPLAALAESRRGLWSVFALVPDPGQPDVRLRRIDRREVEVVHAEASRAYVRGTVSSGDRIVARGAHRVVPGQLVEVVEPSPPVAVAEPPRRSPIE